MEPLYRIHFYCIQTFIIYTGFYRISKDCSSSLFIVLVHFILYPSCQIFPRPKILNVLCPCKELIRALYAACIFMSVSLINISMPI